MSNRGSQLEFTDCDVCGKRVATTAKICHHCHTRRTPEPASKQMMKSQAASDSQQEDEDDDEAHYALGVGGYGDSDDEESSDPKRENLKSLWRSVAWLLLILFIVVALLPLLSFF